MNRAPTWDRQPLADLTRSLTATCMVREPADLVIVGGRLVSNRPAGETVFPPRTPFFDTVREPPGSLTHPPHAHRPEVGL
jgi:hypothetical protein